MPEIDPQTQTMIDAMPEKTGHALSEWFALLAEAQLESHGTILKHLKGQYGLTHGYANTIALLYRQHLAGGPPSAEDLVEQQYAGAKAALRPICDALLEAVAAFGPDVEVAPKKAYVSLRRTKQFAIIQPTTRSRVDLGLNLRGAASTDRLQGGGAFGGMCTHRVALTSVEDVDADLISWLRDAYAQA